MKTIKRIIDLGPRGLYIRIQNRLTKKMFAMKWRNKALLGKANCEWNPIFAMFVRGSGFIKKVLTPKKISLTHVKKVLTELDPKTYPFPFTFYKDIHLKKNETPTLASDIKTPWEKSRFQYSFKNHQEFTQHIEYWIEKNPFLMGVNWVCTMEVAIRAINWIFSSHHFWKSLSENFRQTFTCSLYDHFTFIENNFEESDRPNNHYLAELVGYFYLCTFFGYLKRRKSTYKKIIKQFEHQINPDGTSYEGSTSYHKLDTELLRIFILACKAESIEVPKSLHKKFSKMIEFATQTAHVQIGDNDSGIILRGIKLSESKTPKTINHFRNFGLSIINHKKWNVTFRHPTYKPHQPTGHFHNDALSITLTYGHIPIIIDPGSYVYTPSAYWRNKLRSYESHSTFFRETEESIPPNVDLFQLPRKQQSDTAKINESEKNISIENTLGPHTRTRKITLDKEKETLSIEDLVHKSGTYIWNFLFHPDVTVGQDERLTWIISHQNKKILKLASSLELKKTDGFFSPRYGKIEACTKLTCKKVTPKNNSIKPHKDLTELRRF